jgi:two-component system, OmpR family, sensor histidine kinase KdpD
MTLEGSNPAAVPDQAAGRPRGKLKVFFGAAAGVGKTYAMLEAARLLRAAGMDVVAGVVETHRRAETEALLAGLEVLPRRFVSYRGASLREFDLDAALERRPAVILVDELAHSNAPGSRHAKRWQDALELLDAGITVYTTLNVQHLESLNDVIAKITGVVVRETVPDSVFEDAAEIELVDLPAEDLRQRLREGKVYVPEQAAAAARHFFREGNLIALRELALRRTADRVDAQMQRYRRDQAIQAIWPVAERILVCVGPSPLSAQLVRGGRRLATRLGAEWAVAYIETPDGARLADDVRARVLETLRLAENLGAETVILSGPRMSDEILSYARSRSVSKIVIGKPGRPLWKRLLFGSIVDALVRGSDDIDIYVISGDREAEPARRPRGRPRPTQGRPYGLAILAVGVSTAVAWPMVPRFNLSTIIMVYLLGLVAASLWTPRGPSVLASILSVAAFDFFFVPPYFSLAVSDPQYLLTFAVMLIVALVVSGLTVRVRGQAEAAGHRERRTTTLHALSRELAGTRGIRELLDVSVRHLADAFGERIVILLPDAAGRLEPRVAAPPLVDVNPTDRAVAQWAIEHRQKAGAGTDCLPGAQMLFVPLIALRGTVGVLGMRPRDARVLETPEQRHLLETFASQIALAIERGLLAEEAEAAHVRAEAERLRNALLSAVSNDLRTPLASITGGVSSVLESGGRFDAATERDLLRGVHEEAERLNRLVQNLLEMTRLESGAVQVRTDWHPIEELVGAALGRFSRRLGERSIVTRLPADLPLVALDPVLIEQVLVNLIDNALTHTPPESPIEISARADSDGVSVEVADRGAGLPAGEERQIFDKFHQGRRPSGPGIGLGLAVCQGVVEAHGGRIWAENRPGGGVAVGFTLPIKDVPPAMPPADE